MDAPAVEDGSAADFDSGDVGVADSFAYLPLLAAGCLLPLGTLQSNEAYPISRLGLEFRGPLGSVFAEKVDAQPKPAIIQGVDSSGDFPFVLSVDGNQVNCVRCLAGV